ncbi:MAG: hypothetical protein Q4D14_01770 [Bacteroidales bacterium]|nr:hypothetical protein [Bacteroidales bacterium]
MRQKRSKRKEPIVRNTLKREHRLCILLNDKEKKMLELYTKRFKIKNTSKCVREILMNSVFERMDSACPTLFDQGDLTQPINKINDNK